MISDKLQPQPAELSAEVLDHQRPDGLLGEWEAIPQEDWNLHQRAAHETGGWVTAANAVSLLGAAATIKGGVEYARGNHSKALAYVGFGRVMDLVDGVAAKKFGTRGKTGALVDAGADKVLTVGAAVELAVTGTVPPASAAATLVQQGRIFAHNLAIEKAGGEPNPSKAGKHGMFAIWTGVAARIAEKALKTRYPRVAKVAGVIATGSETTALALTEQAIGGYKSQRQSMDA